MIQKQVKKYLFQLSLQKHQMKIKEKYLRQFQQKIEALFQTNKNMKKKVHLETSLNRMKDIKKKTKKLTKMVVVNGLLYFISHAPEFVSTLLLLIFSKKLLHFCNERISCDLINEEAEFFIIISMISNFFIFKHFNKNFRNSFRQLIR